MFASKLATVIVGFVLLLIVTSIPFHLVRAKKQGKSSCGCDCGGCTGCAMAGSCHPKA